MPKTIESICATKWIRPCFKRRKSSNKRFQPCY
jgi:hypothetical protein